MTLEEREAIIARAPRSPQHELAVAVCNLMGAFFSPSMAIEDVVATLMARGVTRTDATWIALTWKGLTL